MLRTITLTKPSCDRALGPRTPLLISAIVRCHQCSEAMLTFIPNDNDDRQQKGGNAGDDSLKGGLHSSD